MHTQPVPTRTAVENSWPRISDVDHVTWHISSSSSPRTPNNNYRMPSSVAVRWLHTTPQQAGDLKIRGTTAETTDDGLLLCLIVLTPPTHHAVAKTSRLPAATHCRAGHPPTDAQVLCLRRVQAPQDPLLGRRPVCQLRARCQRLPLLVAVTTAGGTSAVSMVRAALCMQDAGCRMEDGI